MPQREEHGTVSQVTQVSHCLPHMEQLGIARAGQAQAQSNPTLLELKEEVPSGQRQLARDVTLGWPSWASLAFSSSPPWLCDPVSVSSPANMRGHKVSTSLQRLAKDQGDTQEKYASSLIKSPSAPAGSHQRLPHRPPPPTAAPCPSSWALETDGELASSTPGQGSWGCQRGEKGRI
jgi:hypothetical protein